MSENTEFYYGILYCLITLKVFDQPTMTDEIINSLSEKEQKELVRLAKQNEEYESSGLKLWKESRKQR